MKKEEFRNDLAKTLIELDDDTLLDAKDPAYFTRRRRSRRRARTLIALVAAFALLAVSLPLALFLNKAPETPIGTVSDFSTEALPFAQSSTLGNGGGAEYADFGVSLIARAVKMLPDDYLLYGYHEDKTFRIHEMETVTSPGAPQMPASFYLLLPEEYAVDLTAYEKLALFVIPQLCHEDAVVYNKTESRAESLSLMLFGGTSYGGIGGMNCCKFAAIRDGKIDASLWSANETWKRDTAYSLEKYLDGEAIFTVYRSYVDPAQNKTVKQDSGYNDILEAVKAANENDEHFRTRTIRSIDQATSAEAIRVLQTVKPFDHGVYVPDINAHYLAKDPMQFQYRRYINGFATSEYYNIMDNNHVQTPERVFTDEDLKSLPDAAGAMDAVKSKYDEGGIVPPHFTAQNAFFGWYAKTDRGVFFVVKVMWLITAKNMWHYDDCYFITSNNGADLKEISRDDLLEILGNDNSFVYQDEYNAVKPYC